MAELVGLVEIAHPGEGQVHAVVGLFWELVDRGEVLAEVRVHFFHVGLH